MLALQQAQVGQRKLRKRVRKHLKAFMDAQAEIQNYHTALQARRNQVENAVRERNEAQARMMQMTREREMKLCAWLKIEKLLELEPCSMLK